MAQGRPQASGHRVKGVHLARATSTVTRLLSHWGGA